MRAERGLDDHLGADLALEQLELGVLGEALRPMYRLCLDLEDLVADDEGACTVAPLDDSSIAFHLQTKVAGSPKCSGSAHSTADERKMAVANSP